MSPRPAARRLTRTITLRATLATLAVLVLAPMARAQDGPVKTLERWWKEGAIERKMALAEVRGTLGRKPPAPDWTARRHGKGQVEVKEGVPVVRLEGTPEEIGEQHGALLAREARALVDHYLPSFIGKSELPKARRRARALFEKHLTDSERRELAAFAKASGIDAADVLLAQGFTDLYRAAGCSTLAATGPSAPTEPLLARNLDFVDMGFIHAFSCVFVVRPEGKAAWASVGWPGLLGVLSGQSERGVALAVMVVHDERGCRAGVPFQLAFRRALEAAEDAPAVAPFLEGLTLTVANNLTVVDRKGGARVLEITPDRIVAREPDARGRLSSTNHFVSDELEETRLSLTYRSSKKRLAAVAEACRDADVVTLEVAIKALRASAPARLNVQAMIFSPGTLDLHVALGKPRAADHPFVRLDGKWLGLARP